MPCEKTGKALRPASREKRGHSEGQGDLVIGSARYQYKYVYIYIIEVLHLLYFQDPSILSQSKSC